MLLFFYFFGGEGRSPAENVVKMFLNHMVEHFNRSTHPGN